VFVFRFDPFQADYHQQHAAFRDAFFNRFTEVASRLDSGYVHEYRVFAEVLDQVVEQTTSLALRITAPIADKDAAQLAFPYGPQDLLTRAKAQIVVSLHYYKRISSCLAQALRFGIAG
jgi:hypothetical protein